MTSKTDKEREDEAAEKDKRSAREAAEEQSAAEQARLGAGRQRRDEPIPGIAGGGGTGSSASGRHMPPDMRLGREGAAEPAPIDEFPKMKYHAQLRTTIVHSPEEEAALGRGWVDRLDQLPAPSLLPSGDHTLPDAPTEGAESLSRGRR